MVNYDLMNDDNAVSYKVMKTALPYKNRYIIYTGKMLPVLQIYIFFHCRADYSAVGTHSAVLTGEVIKMPKAVQKEAIRRSDEAE